MYMYSTVVALYAEVWLNACVTKFLQVSAAPSVARIRKQKMTICQRIDRDTDENVHAHYVRNLREVQLTVVLYINASV